MARTALVVDDVAFARRIIKEILIAAKYNVVGEASNGEDAIKQYNALKPDFVTMDVVMPGKGGIEATRAILDQNKSAKIILVSALAHENLLMEAINAGARDYIVKPFSPDEILKSIEKLFEEEDSSLEKGGTIGL